MMKRLLLSVLLATLPATVVPAAEGSVPISGPFTISVPGAYLVTNDIAATAGSAIVIKAMNVTLDLNGRTLSSPAGADVILISEISASSGVVVRHGRLAGGANGIHSGGSNRVSLRVEDVEVDNVVSMGIYVEAAQSVDIVGCRIHDAGHSGIFVLGSTGAFDGRVSGNLVEGRIHKNGIVLNGLASGEVKGNVVADFGLDAGAWSGIQISALTASWRAGGNLVIDNTVSSFPGGLDDYGIRIDSFSPRNLLMNNDLRKNGLFGIWVASDDNRLVRNIASDNGSHGLTIGIAAAGSRNHLEGNQTQGNAGCGINFSNTNSHLYRNNILRTNTGGCVCGAGAPIIDAGGNIC